MKNKILLIPLVFLFVLFFQESVISKTVTIVKLDNNNEYGGQTIQQIYQSGQEEEGVYKQNIFYDSNKIVRKVKYFYIKESKEKFKSVNTYFNRYGRKTKEELFYNKEHINEYGVYQCYIFLSENGQIALQEDFFIKSFSNKYGYKKVDDHFNEDGFNTYSEWYYTNEYSDEKGYDRVKMYYYENRTVEKMEYYKNDELVNLEYYKDKEKQPKEKQPRLPGNYI